MKVLFLGCCFLYLSMMRVECKPQITKLYPVPEEPGEYQQREEAQQQVSNEVRPLDKFLGKLKATYNFVFRKPEDTENQTTTKPSLREDKMLTISNENNWIQSIPPADSEKPVEPLGPLEIEEEDKNLEVETINPGTGLHLPVTLSRQLVEWLGSFLGLTYNVYSKLAKAVHIKN